MIVATETTIELLCSSAHDGQVTLCINSSNESFIYSRILLIIIYYSHGWRDSNSQPMVLETTTLPIELHPFIAIGEHSLLLLKT